MNRLRTARRLLPALVPAAVIEDCAFNAVPPPITTAPIGAPATHPGRSHRRLAGEEIAAARESDPRRIQDARREHVLLLHAGHLFAQPLHHGLSGFADGVFAKLSSMV